MKPVTVQRVSSILRKAGFLHVPLNNPMPRPGFKVYSVDNRIYVRHAQATGTDAALVRYRSTLEAAGVVLTNDSDVVVCVGISDEN